MNTIVNFPNMDNRKILFLSETHFQFINCINIASHTKNSKCDLYINEMYENAKEIATKIRELKIFNQVRTYNVKSNNCTKLINFLNLSKHIRDMLGVFDYDIVFFASRDAFTRCVITYCKYVKTNIQIISYDEGLGTYISKMECYTNNIEKFIIRLRYHDEPSFYTDKILYKPEAYIGGADDIKLYRMPDLTESTISLLNGLYEYDDSKQFAEKYVYFDGYYDGKDSYRKEIVDLLLSKTNGELLIKMHPHTPEGAYKSGQIYQYSQLPYEVIAANDTNIENRCLITIMSTSVWTPMLMFNRFPKIILLYPIFDKGEENEAWKIIEKMIDCYDKEKVLVVDSINELKKMTL